MVASTGRREPISMSGAGKAVGVILLRTALFFLGVVISDGPLRPGDLPPPHPRRLVICVPQQFLAECAFHAPPGSFICSCCDLGFECTLKSVFLVLRGSRSAP